MKRLALTTALVPILATAATVAAFPAIAQSSQPSPSSGADQIARAAQDAQINQSARPQEADKSAPATAEPAGPPPIKLSKKGGKAIVELQTAIRANDVANIPAKVAAAKAVADTPDDLYAIGKLELGAATTAKNNEAMVVAINDIAASQFLPKSTVAALYNSVGVAFFNAKNLPRATTMFKTALALDPNNSDTLRLIAESQSAGASPAEAVGAMRRAIEQASASGTRLPEDSYKRAVKVAYEAQDKAAVDFGREWIRAYPSPDSWTNGIAIYRNMLRPDVEGTLDLLRLLRATNALSTSANYTLYATAASDQGNFGEAQAVMDEGLANKLVDRSSTLARDVINGLKSKPKANASELETAAKTVKTPTSMIAVGNRFYGIGNYARAADLFRMAVAAGGDSSLANLHLGMALARTGDKPGATAALNAVSGAYAPVAQYWLIYVNRAG